MNRDANNGKAGQKSWFWSVMTKAMVKHGGGIFVRSLDSDHAIDLVGVKIQVVGVLV